MLDLRLSVFPHADTTIWYVYLGEEPIHTYLGSSQQSETPCNLEALKQSVLKDGLHCLFWDTVADPADFSIWIEVSHVQGFVRWGKAYRNNDLGEPGEFIADINWKFDRSEYEDVIKKAAHINSLATPLIID